MKYLRLKKAFQPLSLLILFIIACVHGMNHPLALKNSRKVLSLIEKNQGDEVDNRMSFALVQISMSNKHANENLERKSEGKDDVGNKLRWEWKNDVLEDPALPLLTVSRRVEKKQNNQAKNKLPNLPSTTRKAKSKGKNPTPTCSSKGKGKGKGKGKKRILKGKGKGKSKSNFECTESPTTSPTFAVTDTIKLPTKSPATNSGSSSPSMHAKTNKPSGLSTKTPLTSLSPTAVTISSPSSLPTSTPSLLISKTPSGKPSIEPSSSPFILLSTPPSSIISSNPSEMISNVPSRKTSIEPSTESSKSPSSTPSVLISNVPSRKVSIEPSPSISAEPSLSPSFILSSTPSTITSHIPSQTPSIEPINDPTAAPSSILPHCQHDECRFVLHILPDNYPQETTWTLRNSTGDIVLRGDSVGVATCIKSDQYTFTIFDVNGDGICCEKGYGFYDLYVNDELVKEGGDFGFQETTEISKERYNGSYPQVEPSSTPPNVHSSPMPSLLPTKEWKESLLSFTDIALDLSFPRSRRVLERRGNMQYHNRSLNEDLITYDDGGLFAVVYKVIFESFQTVYSPYFSGLTISLEKISEDLVSEYIVKDRLKVSGDVAVNSNDMESINALRQADEVAIEALRGEKFLQVLKKSNDLTLADVINTQAYNLYPVGNSIISEEGGSVNKDRRGSMEVILISTVACCLLLTASIFVCFFVRKEKSRSTFHSTDSLPFQDDCSTNSPGSSIKYKHDNYSADDAASNWSTAPAGMNNGFGIPEIPLMTCNGHVAKFKTESRFESIWNNRSDESCSCNDTKNKEASCAESVSSDSTPKSTNISPKQKCEV